MPNGYYSNYSLLLSLPVRLVFFTMEVIVGKVTSSCEYITLSTPFSSFDGGGGASTPPGIRNTVKKNISEPKSKYYYIEHLFTKYLLTYYLVLLTAAKLNDTC